jgi:antitoxin (DNA-binding transcriptional repressor) of toxin-antitoxin stability system
MVKATIFEAKTNLSALVKKAQKGETVIITSGRKKIPVAKLEPVKHVAKRRLGSMEIPGYVPTDSIFEPLPKGWNGEDD